MKSVRILAAGTALLVGVGLVPPAQAAWLGGTVDCRPAAAHIGVEGSQRDNRTWMTLELSGKVKRVQRYSWRIERPGYRQGQWKVTSSTLKSGRGYCAPDE